MRKCFLAALFACCHLFCHSQVNKYRFRFISLPENFKGQFISLVDEDAAGMLWFVTNNGLHRYDGNRVLTFDMQSSPALPDITIRRLFADSHHNLWIAARKELICFDLQRWTLHQIPLSEKEFSSPQDRFVSAFAEGPDGTVYAGFGNGNVYRITDNRLHFIASVNAGGNAGKGNFAAVTSIQETSEGEIWLTTDKGEIVTLTHSQNAYGRPVFFSPPELSGVPINFFSHASGKSLLYAEGKGAFLFERANAGLLPLSSPPGLPPLKNKNVYPVRFDESRIMFFYAGIEAGKTGLAVYDFKDGSFSDVSSVYPPSFRGCLFRGITCRNSQVLIPSNRGIAVASLTKSPIDVYGSTLENLNSIRTFFKPPGRDLLFSSYLQKFSRFDEDANRSVKLSDRLVACFLPWRSDTLLAGMEGEYLCWYLTGSNRFVPLFRHGDSAGAPVVNPYVHCLVRENDTTVWVGTYAGFYTLNPYTGKVLKGSADAENKPLQKSIVYDVLKTGRQRFIATSEGLFKQDTGSGKISRQLSGSGYGFANFSCLRRVNGEIWAGTLGHGIAVMDTQGTLLRHLTTADGLAGNVVFSNPLCKDYILAGTGSGLSIINVRTGAVSSYSTDYYLPSNEFNRSAWFVTGDTVYMGTVNGFIRIVVNRLAGEQGKTRPGICFSGFTLNNGKSTLADYTLPYRANASLTIPPQAGYFSIAVGGLSPMAESLNLYYRLGTQGPWQDIGQQREITFSNLAPGNFTLQVAARLPDGSLVENVLSIPVAVQPRFYQTVWFRALLGAVALALLWLGIKFRERGLLKEYKLRSRIAGDLHDEVGSTLTRIYFQAGQLSGGAAAGKPDPVLQKIAASSQEALSSISDMVWSIDAHFDNASDMVDRMKDYLARLQEELDCRCLFEASGAYQKKHLDQISRQNIFLIFKECLNNAVKHGAAGGIAVTIAFEENVLHLTVRNRLQPYQKKAGKVQGGAGLQGMNLRAAKIRGTLSVLETEAEFVVRLAAPV